MAAYNKTASGRWAILIAVAALPRMIGAIFLPNAFGDAYVYIQEIGNLTTKISHHSFRLTDLFGFWLPLYQFISAAFNLVINNGFYSGKVVAALFGAAACLLVYLITEKLTKNTTAATWMFLLIALNPLHIFYSASAMTDVPHAFFVLAALYFVLMGNWIVAAVFGALAGFTRVESWMLIALIPCLQFVRERRISIAAVLVLVVPPLLWFYVSWRATGNWLACFIQRQEYHDWLLRMNPAIAHFGLMNILKDTATLLVSSDIVVLVASFVAVSVVLKRFQQILKPRAQTDDVSDILPPVCFFFVFLSLLLIAYLTRQQPIIFPRYGLILFSLGLPMVAWTFLWMRKLKPQLTRRVLLLVGTIFVIDFGIQFVGVVGTVKQYRVQRAVADYLRDHFDAASDAQIFCDDGTVRVLSGIEANRFLTSAQAPEGTEAFRTFIKTNRIEYVVVANNQGASPEITMRDGESPEFESFEPVLHRRTSCLPTNIWLLKRTPVSEARP